MNIHGFTKTTLLDFPGFVAATIFTGGCNFKCPFCHNFELVLTPDIYPKEDENDILTFLKKRYGILKGVCISGGEPTLQPDLVSFIEKIKEIGYLIKLDTNGYKPDVIKELIDRNLIDYIAMDIKASKENYSKASGIDIDIDIIQKSIDIISSSNIDYEFRTTIVKNLHTIDDFKAIADWLPSKSKYFLQSYKETTGIGNYNFESFDVATLNEFLDIVQKQIPNTSLRGIE